MTFIFIYLICICIFKICVKQCLCTFLDKTSLDDLKDDLIITSEEILRRRQSVETYLSKIADEEKDWIDTYYSVSPQSRNLAHTADTHLLYPKFSESKSKISRNEFASREISNVEHDSNDLNFVNSKFKKSNNGIRTRKKTINKNQCTVDSDEVTAKKQSVYSSIPEPSKSTKSSTESYYAHDSFGRNEDNLDTLSNNSSMGNNDSVSKIKSTEKSDKFCVREKAQFYMTKTCDAEKYRKPYAEKRKGDMPQREKSFEKTNVRRKLSSATEINVVEKSLVTYNKVEDSKYGMSKDQHRDQNHRQNFVNSYLASLIENQENWIETYHSSFPKDVSEQDNRAISDPTLNYFNYKSSESQFANFITKTDNHAGKKKLLHSQEWKYLIRWSKILLRKFSDYSINDHSSLSFTFSINSLNALKELSSSKSFDIVLLDDLISGLISNATFHNMHHLNSFYASYMPNNTILLYILCGIFFMFVLKHFPYVGLIFAAVTWNAFKMYQQKVAEKHSVMSRVNSAYCESILTHESGVFAHIKEYFRSYYHDEDCQKYYAALLIDPLSEISFPVIVSDLISSTIFQILRTFGHFLNMFYKELVYGIGYIERAFLFTVLCILLIFFFLILLTYRGYKLKLPFFMGSVEPSAAPVGSRVQDVELNNKKEKLVLQDSSHIYVYKERDKLYIKLPHLVHPKECMSSKTSEVIVRRYSL